MYRSSDVGPRLIQGWCCSTEANSVEASAPSSLSRTWRYSSGICSTVSTFRIPRRTPHSTARDTDTGTHLLRWTRSEEHTLNSSHSQISYAVFCLKKKKERDHRLLL